MVLSKTFKMNFKHNKLVEFDACLAIFNHKKWNETHSIIYQSIQSCIFLKFGYENWEPNLFLHNKIGKKKLLVLPWKALGYLRIKNHIFLNFSANISTKYPSLNVWAISNLSLLDVGECVPKNMTLFVAQMTKLTLIR